MISNIDLGVIAAYFVVVIIIGIYVGARVKTGGDLFLGGRSLTWGFIGLSLFASNISSTTLIGLAGSAYTSGIANAVYEFGIGVPFLLLAAVFAPLYITARITTVPEFLEYRFDRRSRVFFSAITIVVSIVVDTAGGLYAGSIVLQMFFPDLVLWQTCFVLALIAGLYTAFGGLKAVVYTDAIQAVILIVGSGILTYTLFQELDFSWPTLVASVSPDYFSVARPIDDPTLPWPGLFIGIPFLGFWYIATNQYITQRVLGAKDIDHARWGIMLASVLKLLPFFIMILPGVMMISVMPGLPNGDLVFPTAVLEFLPAGVVGLVLAGLISAIMSSVDSTLNSASTLIVHDFVRAKRPNLSPQDIAKYGRISTVILMVVAAVWAPMIANFGGLWSYLQQMFAIFVPPIVVLFLVGTFYKRANGSGAIWTLVMGTAMGAILFGLVQAGIWQVHFLINIGLVVFLSTLVFIGVSALTPPPSAETVERFTFRRELLTMNTEGVAWYKDYRYQGAFVLALVILNYWWLW